MSGPPPPPPPAVSLGGGAGGGGRANLLQSIQGAGLGALKKVEENDKPKPPLPGAESLDMAGLLAAAMSNRRAGVQDSDEDGWSEEEGDDWE